MVYVLRESSYAAELSVISRV